MTESEKHLTATDRLNLAVAMDRIVPAVDDLPGAGEMGLGIEAEAIAERIPRYREAMIRVLDAITLDPAARVVGGFRALEDDQQVESLKAIEAAMADYFGDFVHLVYTAYYSDARVHSRIGWRSGAPQPAGWHLPPFDASILETVSKREPFWRKT